MKALRTPSRPVRNPAAPDGLTIMAGNTEKQQARRIQRDGRVLVLPPEGYGDQWSGGAR